MASPFFTSEMFLEYSRISHLFLRQHKPQIHACTLWYKLFIQMNFKVVFIDRWYFYTGSLQDRFHCNSPSQEQLCSNAIIQPVDKHIMEKFTVHIYILNLFFLYATLKLYKYVLYNIFFVNK